MRYKVPIYGDFGGILNSGYYINNQRHLMTPELTILVAYGSWHIGARIIQRLCRIDNIEIVGQAHDADDALAQIALKKPGLAIIDVQLSQGTGFDVLRSAKMSASAPLVMMTSASIFPQYRKECLKEGSDYYFYLPDEIEKLTATVINLSGDRSERSMKQDRHH